jgi:anti-sigma B factor antagonist
MSSPLDLSGIIHRYRWGRPALAALAAYADAMSDAGLHFRVEQEDFAVRLAVTGEVDLHTADSLLRAGRDQLAQSPERLVLDLSGVPFCDSIGLSALVALRRHSEAAGCQFTVAGAQAVVAEALAISGLEDYLGVPVPERRHHLPNLGPGD